jgi:hypothetical protein
MKSGGQVCGMRVKHPRPNEALRSFLVGYEVRTHGTGLASGRAEGLPRPTVSAAALTLWRGANPAGYKHESMRPEISSSVSPPDTFLGFHGTLILLPGRNAAASCGSAVVTVCQCRTAASP